MPSPLFVHVEECESTQDLAWAAQPPTSPHGTFYTATRQTRGRGRRSQREWVSPAGGLYLSWRVQPRDPSGYSLLGGLAVARCLQHFGARPWLKWPNDCWIGAQKIAGVLSDCRWRGAHNLGLVLGIGVNLRVDPEQLPEQATSLHLCCPNPPDVAEFTNLLAEHLIKLWEVHEQRGLAGYLDEIRPLSLPMDTPIRYWIDEEAREGFVAGLDDQGWLLLRGGERLTAVDRLIPLRYPDAPPLSPTGD